MIDFKVGDYNYRAQKMDAMTQFHVMCKFGPAMNKSATSGGETMLDVFSHMSDVDREYIINETLAIVQREQNGQWANIWNKQVKRPMFEDINAVHVMDISSNVMDGTFKDFFPAPQSTSDESREE